MAGGSAPRYAPDDPSLARPWKALVDGNTGYIYYWNTETNVTQYEKPLLSPSGPPLPPGLPPPPAGGPKQASLQVEDASDGHGSKMPERRSSRMLSNAGGRNSSRVESMHPLVPPQHKSGRFSSLSSQMSGSPENPHSSGGTMSTQHQRQHISEHHGRNVADNHGRFTSDNHNRSAADHPSGPITEHHSRSMSGDHKSDHHNRSMPESHGGLMSDHHTRSMPDSHGGHMPDQSRLMRDHHGGHVLEHDSWTVPDHHVSRPGHASASRSSGHVMPGGNIHSSVSDNSWGGSSGRHGSSAGSIKGIPLSRSNPDVGGAWNAPKLSALPIPQRQQRDMGGMHYPDRPHQGGRLNSPNFGRSPLPGTPTGAFKRTAPDHPIDVPDTHKRPRLQAFSEPSRGLDPQMYRLQHEITVTGENIPAPFTTFELGNFPPEIMRELRTAGFAAPTPIQAQAWPIALQARDVVAIAKTGSGKTLGYLLPAFLNLIRTRAHSRAGPIVLVLAPTRELATQIQDEAMKFGRSSRITSTCVYGGAPKGPQLRDLERGADIVIATPGRLNDFLEVKRINLRQVSYLVLDEADRMLDMGFEPQIRKIVNEVPSSRQTLMFTATWPREVRRIAADLLVNPVQVYIGNSDELTANKAITQHVEVVQPFHKQRRLEEILRNQQLGSKVIIFCSTKKMCDQLARSLSRGFRAVAIHGDKSQNERDHVLAQFKAGRSPILVATDVAARGLDVKDIRVVINYDFPTGVEDYVHRIGRTGRAGATGEAFTFFSEQDAKYARELIKILEGADQRVPIELRQLAGRGSQSRGRPHWQSGGMSMVDDPVDSRSSIGHRTVGTMSRDVGVRGGGFGHRDDCAEAAGRWGFIDGGIGDKGVERDHAIASRGVVGERVGRDGRIGSRVESVVIRDGSIGSGREVVPASREDVNGAAGARRGGAFSSRGEKASSIEGGFRPAKGIQDDGWDLATHGDDDGWGDGGSGSSAGTGLGHGPRFDGARGPVGHANDVRPLVSNRVVGGRREGWGDEGQRIDGPGRTSGGRGLSCSSGRRPNCGRIFDRLGEQGRRDARTDMSRDGRFHDGDDLRRPFGGKEDAAGRSWGSYNRSPVGGWEASQSRSPRRKLHSRSCSHTPRVGSHGDRSHSPSHARRTDDRRWLSREGPRIMSTISPVHYSPDKCSQHLQLDISQEKASRKGEPGSPGAELKGVRKEVQPEDQLNISTARDTHAKEESVTTAVAPSLDNESDMGGKAEQEDLGLRDAGHDSRRTESVLQDDEITRKKGLGSPPTDVAMNVGAVDNDRTEAEPLSDKAYKDAVTMSSKENDGVDDSRFLPAAIRQGIKVVDVAAEHTLLDSVGTVAVEEQHATSEKMTSTGNEYHDGSVGFVARALELSENHIDDGVISSPEEGMVL